MPWCGAALVRHQEARGQSSVPRADAIHNIRGIPLGSYSTMTAVFVDRPIGTSMGALAVALLGVVACLQLPVDLLPSLELPRVSIEVRLQDASPTTIVIAPDTPQKRAAYEEQVIRTFYVSHANVDDLLELVSALVQIPQMPVQPQLVASVETNTLIVRGPAALVRVRGADRRGAGQAPGRDRGRRGDSRGEPRPRPSVRPRPVAVCGGGGPLTGGAAGVGRRGRRFAGQI